MLGRAASGPEKLARLSVWAEKNELLNGCLRDFMAKMVPYRTLHPLHCFSMDLRRSIVACQDLQLLHRRPVHPLSWLHCIFFAGQEFRLTLQSALLVFVLARAWDGSKLLDPVLHCWGRNLHFIAASRVINHSHFARSSNLHDEEWHN